MARLPRIVVPHAEEWRWPSARARLPGRNDRLVTVAPVLERYERKGDRFILIIR